MRQQSNDTRKAKVKGTDREVEVYKLKAKGPGGVTRWHIFLGDKLNMKAIEAGAHNEEWSEDQLQFIN